MYGHLRKACICILGKAKAKAWAKESINPTSRTHSNASPVGGGAVNCSLALRQIGLKKREIFRNLYCNPCLTAYFPVAEVGLAPRLQTNMSNIKVRFKIIGIKSQNDKYIWKYDLDLSQSHKNTIYLSIIMKRWDMWDGMFFFSSTWDYMKWHWSDSSSICLTGIVSRVWKSQSTQKIV